MANINTLYPSKYLKAADLNGKAIRLTISKVLVEEIGGDHRPVLYFQGKEKGMVANKTNAFTVAQAYGPDTDQWTGGEIEVFPAFVDFQGKQMEALRVRIPPRKPAGNGGVTIAPNARARAEMESENPAPLDDDVPF